jgi:hypothetical protein
MEVNLEFHGTIVLRKNRVFQGDAIFGLQGARHRSRKDRHWTGDEGFSFAMASRGKRG